MSTELLEQIEAYLEGRISREELQRTADAEGVKDLEEELKWFENSRTAIEAAGLRNQLDELLPRPEETKAKVRRFRPNRWILAAAASVLLVLAIYWGQQSNRPDLYSQYEYLDPGLPVLMSQSNDHLLYDALTYYGEENYSVAAEKLQNIREQYAESDTLNYYLGASLLYQGKSEAAAPYLLQVSEREESRFQQRAEWLLILASLKEKDLETARDRLKTILETPGHEFLERAQDLQNTLQE